MLIDGNPEAQKKYQEKKEAALGKSAARHKREDAVKAAHNAGEPVKKAPARP